MVVAPPSSIAPPTSIVGLDEPPPVPDEMLAAGPLLDRTPTAHACVLVTDAAQPVLEGASATDVLALGSSFVLAGYVAGTPERVDLARIAAGGSPSPLARVDLPGSLAADRRTVPPVLARLGDATVGVGAIDANGGVILMRLPAGELAPVVTSVQVTTAGADVRYAPALAHVDAGALIAWTEPSGTTAHVRVALVDAAGAVVVIHDVTPEAGAAAAPVFDTGAVLYAVDARAGISVTHRTAFGQDGMPTPTTVAQPINLAAEPPSFAVVRTHLGYAAVGNAATRAVGLVTLGSSDRARALVPGLGYGGALTMDAVPFGSAALFAMEAPSAADASAPHETRVRVVAGETIGEALTIPGLIEPRVASGASAVAVVGRGAELWWARCAE